MESARDTRAPPSIVKPMAGEAALAELAAFAPLVATP
jgi:hypothetical protein